ncbi:uncharacterized protein LOC142107468 [Mixophyes fleayi]|uniref:uncharacterized protein LOC142107468 n=1 Tax=Mixophyes fleayi TaxID=3061075 RepID=UPI003F4E235F
MGLIHLEHYLALIFLMSPIWNIGGQVSGYNLFAPTEVTVQQGLCVHIPCTFTVADGVKLTKDAKGYWYRRDTSHELVAANDGTAVPATRERFFLTGDVWRGDCSLSINNALPSDDDYYQFRLEDTVRFNYRIRLPIVKVAGLTEKPVISPVKRLVAGEEVTLTCTSPGRCAGYAPHITWEGVQGTFETFTVNYTDGNRTYVSNITFTPSEKNNGSPLTCTVNFQRSMVTTSHQIPLNVEYPPSISLNIAELDTNEETPFIVKEGDNKSMKCVVNSNPQAAITLFVRGQLENGLVVGNTLTFELKNIRLSIAGRYWCSAQNEYGTANRSTEIIVQYPPRIPMINCVTDCIVELNNITYALEGSSVSLLCSAKSAPEATLSWIKSNQSIIPTSPTGQLNFPNVSLSDDGLYNCQAKNTHGTSNTLITFRVTYKPKTVSGENSTCQETENLIECTCTFQSFPQAEMKWKIDQKLYPSSYSDKDLNISTVQLNSVTNSTLTLGVNQKNIQNIECISSNKFGQLSLLLLNNSARSIPNVMVIAASCGVIVIVLLLVTGSLFIWYFRKKTLVAKSDDKKEFSNDCNVIYSNTEPYCNGAHKPQHQQTHLEPAQEEGSLYMNCEDVSYASINFSRLKAKPAEEETEIQYAEIKHVGCERIYEPNINAPERVTAQRGLCVHIQCTFTVPSDKKLSARTRGLWYKLYNNADKKVVADTQNKVIKSERFLLTGNVQRGDCSLSINDILPEDQAHYQFRVQDENVNISFESIRPFVIVEDLKDKPEIFLQRLVSGKKVTLTCNSPGRCAGEAPRITWGGVINGEKEAIYTTKHKDGNRSYYSSITFTPTKQNSKLLVNCVVSYQNSFNTIGQRVLNVEYPPSVDITIDDVVTNEIEPVILKEGDSKTLQCTVDSYPEAAVTWRSRGQILHGPMRGPILTYELRNISPHDAGTYWCSAQNEHKITYRRIVITVQSTPRRLEIRCYTESSNVFSRKNCIVDVNNTVYASEGSLLRLSCSAHSNPVASFSWKSDHITHPASSMEELNFANISLNDEGLYTCQASNIHGNSQASVNIKVTYAPRRLEIRCFTESKSSNAFSSKNCTMGVNNTVFAPEGSFLILSCSADSNPAASFLWKSHIYIHSASSLGKLNFPNISLNDEGSYTCQASNNHGNSETSVNVKVTSQMSSKIPMVAAVCGGIFLALLLLAGVILTKLFRTRKRIQKEENTKSQSVNYIEAIYSNSEVTFKGVILPKQTPQKVLKSPREDGSLGMDYEDVQYVNIDFSNLNPRIIKDELEIEYAEIKHTKNEKKRRIGQIMRIYEKTL